VEIGRRVGQGVAGQVVGNALAAGGYVEQVLVQGNIPLPGQAQFGKGQVEGGAMGQILGFGQGAIDIKNQGVELGRIHRLPAA
jgi:hypothetical protein